jgi:hypothetical protein
MLNAPISIPFDSSNSTLCDIRVRYNSLPMRSHLYPDFGLLSITNRIFFFEDKERTEAQWQTSRARNDLEFQGLYSKFCSGLAHVLMSHYIMLHSRHDNNESQSNPTIQVHERKVHQNLQVRRMPGQ